ncbi:LysR family transcriptional regulator [Hoeflea sp.]|uniref:LysR family transcriptional regulator n=1 Tax=Hoeflea sp. TaxID=1940281 RepID=UPI003749393B
MSVSIKAMQYFLAAAEQGSIVKAAKQLNVVPSAVSNAIDMVEAAFGLQLVQRFPAKGIVPTAAGVQVMQKIRSLVDDYELLLQQGTELRTALSGHISVGYYAPVASAFVPLIFAPMLEANPGIRLKLIETDNEAVQDRLLSGEFDLIIFVANNIRTGIVHRKLIEAPPYVLVASEHRLVCQAFVTPDDLRDEPMVLLDLPMTSDYYRSIFAGTDVTNQIVAQANTHEMVRSLVGKNIGFSILNMRPETAATYSGDRVVAKPLKAKTQALELAVGHTGGKQRKLTQAFIDATITHFDQEVARKLIMALN